MDPNAEKMFASVVDVIWDGMLPTQRARVGELISSSLTESKASPASDSASDSTSL